MKCPNCQKQLTKETPFCPECGAPIRNNEEQPSAPVVRKPKALLIVGAVLLFIILAALVAKMAFSGQSVTNTPTPDLSGPSVTDASPPDLGGPSVTDAPAPPVAEGQYPANPVEEQAPPEVVDYMSFVQQIEQHRQNLLNDKSWALAIQAGGTSAEAMRVFGDDALGQSSGPSTSQQIVDYVAKWQTLLRQFDSKRPPRTCQEFSGAYRNVLVSQLTAMNQITTALSTLSSGNTEKMYQAVNELMASAKQMQAQIDNSTDDAKLKLDDCLKQNHMKKTWDISKESAIPGGLTLP